MEAAAAGPAWRAPAWRPPPLGTLGRAPFRPARCVQGGAADWGAADVGCRCGRDGAAAAREGAGRRRCRCRWGVERRRRCPAEGRRGDVLVECEQGGIQASRG